MVKIVDKAREAVDAATPNPEAAKAAALNTCRGAVEMCKGESIPAEIGKLASSCISLPVGVAASGLKACTKLITLQSPLKDIGEGLENAIKDTTSIVTSPARFAGATVHTSVNAVKTGASATKKAVEAVAKAPFTIPLACYNKIGDGLIRIEESISGSSASASSTAKPAAKPAADSSSAKPA